MLHCAMQRLVFIVILCGIGAVAQGQDSKENADFKLAVSLYNDRLYDLALEQFSQFVSTYPNTQQGIEARFYLGLTQSKMRKFEEARFTFQNFALAFPEHPRAAEAWWNSGEAYVELGNLAEAALAFERVKTFHPKSKLAPEALLKASEYFRHANELEKSKRALRTLVQEYASAEIVHEARLRLARIYFAERQYELARSEAKRAADAAPNSPLAPAALQLTAQSLTQLGRIEEAKAVLTGVIDRLRSGTGSYEALLELGKLQKESGQIEEALQTWSSLLEPKASPSRALKEGALLETAEILALRESLVKSIELYEQAANLSGTRAGEAWYKAARVAERMGNKKRVGELALKALEADSGSVFRRAILIAAFRGARFLKQYQTAVAISIRFQDEFPSDPNIPRLLLETGTVYSDDLKDHRHAVVLFEQILADHADSEVADDALFGSARALRNSGLPGESASTLESLLQRFPATDYRGQATEELIQIRTFELKDKDGGLENMALLTGDVIAGKPRADLAFRLAEIYFNDLKDYRNAAAQYLVSLQSGLQDDRTGDAWFKRARALEYSSMRETADRSKVIAQAIAAYDSALKYASSSQTRGEAFVAKIGFSLRTATGVTELRQISGEIRKDSPNTAEPKLLLDLGRQYSDFRSYADARTVFEELLRRNPTEEIQAGALHGLAVARIEMGERDSGYAALAEFTRSFPGHHFAAEAMSRLARFEAGQGRVGSVREISRNLEQRYPYSKAADGIDGIRGDAFYAAARIDEALKYYRLHYEKLENNLFEPKIPSTDLVMKLADCFRRTGAIAEAQRYYALILARDTTEQVRVEVYFAMAGIAREQDNFELAARYLQEASRFGSGTPERQFQAALESADLLFRSEDYSSASQRYTELLTGTKQDSLRRSIQSKLVVCYFRMDNLQEAEKQANAFVKAHAGERDAAAEFEFERGRYHLRKEEIDLAARRFENVRQRYPRSSVIPEAVYWLARTMEAKSQPRLAIQLYDSLLKTFPLHPIRARAQLSLGNVYYALEQWDAAAGQYKGVVDGKEFSPDLVQYAASNLIMAYKEIGLFDAALQLTREYISRYPNDPDVILKHIDIGVLYQKLGYYDQSILHLQKMLENADPELEGELRYYIGEAYFYKGGYQQAILEFLKVPYLITMRTKIDWVATSYYMAGQSYEKMSKLDQAITMYKQIIERPGIDPTFKTAAQKEIDRVNVLVRSNEKP